MCCRSIINCLFDDLSCSDQLFHGPGEIHTDGWLPVGRHPQSQISNPHCFSLGSIDGHLLIHTVTEIDEGHDDLQPL